MSGAPAAASLVLLALAACDGGSRPVIAVNPPSGTGGAPPQDAGVEGGMGGAGGDRPPPVDGGSSPVRVGVSANPRTHADGTATLAQIMEAEIEALAAGSRVRVFSERWRAIDVVSLDRIQTLAKLHADASAQVVFEIAIVDGAADGRPDAVSMLAWDDQATMTALETTLGDVLARFGPELAVLSFGRDIDVYLADHAAERDAFEAMLTQVIASASSHPAAPEALAVGAGFSSAGARAPDPTFPKLIAVSDVAVLSHAPPLEAGAVPPLAAVAEDLDAIAAAVGDRPVVLASLAYPSSGVVQSSPEQQAEFFASFFDALDLRRAAFPWVHVVELNVRTPAACAAIAMDQGEPAAGAYASFVCSRGLRDTEGMARPAWTSVKAGLATFASP